MFIDLGDATLKCLEKYSNRSRQWLTLSGLDDGDFTGFPHVLVFNIYKRLLENFAP